MTALGPACFSLALFVTLGLSGCSDSSPAPTDTAGTPADAAPTTTEDAEARGEQLLAQPPAGWRQISSINTAPLKAAQFVPEEEGEEDQENWTRMIKFESMTEDPLPDPIEFVAFITEGQDHQCGKFESYPVFAGLENGYETAVSLLVCHKDRDTERSEVTMMKTIRGNERFYVVTRAMRGPPITGEETPAVEEQVVAAWSLYMKSIGLCDTGREAHPCPVGASG
jgi:hypothetical protein